jgi:hypothetical protein
MAFAAMKKDRDLLDVTACLKQFDAAGWKAAP